MQKKKAIRALITFLLCVNFTLLNLQISCGLENISSTKPQNFTDEVWTITWGAPNNDRGLLLIEDPKSGDLFWGKTSENSSANTLGVISRISQNGEFKWTQECSGIFNLFYSKPIDLLYDSDNGLLYLLLAFSNGGGTKLGLLLYSVEQGILNSYYLIAESATEMAIIDWDLNGNILILYESAGTESKTYARHFITSTNTIRDVVEITTTGFKVAPVGINGTFQANKAALCLGKILSGGENRVTIVYIDTSTNPLSIIAQQDISMDNSDYSPIGMATDNEKIYLFVKKLTACGLIALDDSFSVSYWKKWTIDEVFWVGFLMSDSRIFYLLGYGTQAFGLESNAAYQGILMKVVENEEGNNFRSVGVWKFGIPDFYDYFTSIYETQRKDLFITGYGKSYGTSPYNDFDAYLIKYTNGYFNLTIPLTEEPSFFEKYIVYLIIGGIALLISASVFFVRNIRMKRKN